MDTPDIKRRNYGRGHGYTLDGQKVPGVTTIISDGLPKPALMGWAAKTIAEYVADRLDQADGHVLADQLVDDLGELARVKGKPWPDKLSRTKVAELLKGIHYEDRDQAAKRGTQVHALAERLARGEEVDVPEPLTGHVDAYLAFLADWQPTDAHLEVTVASVKHRYSGTLDMIATLLSGGLSVAEVSEEMDDEYNVSQVFVAIEVDRLIDKGTRDEKLRRICDYVLTAERSDPSQAIRLPGHEFPQMKAQNKEKGIPVDERVWQTIRAL